MMNTLMTLAKTFAKPLAPALAMLLSACGSPTPSAPIEPPLAGATIGGPFELTSTKGETVRWSDFDGQYRIVYFGFAYCPDICPTDLSRMSQGLKLFGEQEPELALSVQPIFITIDPERDTPDKVGEFIANFTDRLIGLTGTPDQIKQAADTFAVYYGRGEVQADGSYLMDHSAITFLFGPQGEPLATLPTDQGPEAVAAELAKWVR